MYIRSYLDDKRITIALSGEVDHQEACHAMKVVAEKIDGFLPKVCVLDFRDVTFMDSSGIAIVILGVRRMREIGGKLVLQNLQQQPLKVLLAAGVDQIAEIRGGESK